MADKTTIYSPDMSRENRIPPGQQLIEQWPVLQHDNVHRIEIKKWRIKIFGLIKTEMEMDFEEFSSLPQVIVHSDIHCVTGWSMLDNVWQGPASRTIFDIASVLPSAGYVIIHAAGGFTTNLTLSDFLENDVLFTLKYNGEALTPDHGYPVRLIVPRLYFWKSAKWVDGIEFTKEDKQGFWETSGYHNHGDPWKEERFSY